MYPDLLGIFGIQLYGLGFERFLWAALALLMLWGVISSIMAFVKGRKAEGIGQGLIVGFVLVWAVQKLSATFSPDYALMFSKPIVLHSYAFCILVGIGLGIWTARAQGRRRGFDPGDISKLCLMLVVFGLIGARLAHVIVDASTYWNSCFDPGVVGLSSPNCMRIIDVSEGGLTFYGGVIAGMIVLAWFFIRRYRQGQAMGTLSLLDILASALAIAHACGRVGCIAAGCCWGAVTTGSLGFKYDRDSFAFEELVKNPLYHDEMMHSGGTPLLHATQLYEVLGELVLYGILWTMLLKHAKAGKMAGLWLIGYGVLRFVVEFMRDDPERGYYFEQVIEPINRFFHVAPDHATVLSTSQGIALVMIGLGTLAFVLSHVLSKKGDQDNQNACKTAA